MPDEYINGKPKDHPPDNAVREESGLTMREETALMRRAVRERWPIAQEYRDGIIKRLTKIALDPQSGARASVSASRVIVSADKLNLDEELKATPDQLNVEVNHTGGVQIYLPDNRRGIQPPLIENGHSNGHVNGHA